MVEQQTHKLLVGGSNPSAATNLARVVKLVYTHDSKSCAARHVGSTPTSGTTHVIHPRIAQLVEQLPLKQTVGGSNPSARTIDKITNIR